MSFDQILVGNLGQQEAGQADGKHADQRDLGGFQRIADGKHNGEHGHQERKNVFYQKQAAGALQIVDHLAALQNYIGHPGKIRFQKYQLGSLSGGVASGSHGHRTVRVFQGQHIVDSVPGHGHGFSGGLQSLYKLTFLIRSYPAEDGIFYNGVRNVLRCLQGGGVHIVFRMGDARLGGHIGYSHRVISGNDLDFHPLLCEVPEGFRSVLADGVGEQDQTQGRNLLCESFSCGSSVIQAEDQHPVAQGALGLNLFPIDIVIFPEDKLRRSQNIGACGKGGAAVFESGGEGGDGHRLHPSGLHKIFLQGRHGYIVL